jgi:hypothetical protein
VNSKTDPLWIISEPSAVKSQFLVRLLPTGQTFTYKLAVEGLRIEQTILNNMSY